MRRLSLTLLTLALTGWLIAGVAHVRSLRTDNEDERSRWTMRRNQCLLLSSVSMNSLVVITLYRYVKNSRIEEADTERKRPGHHYSTVILSPVCG
jgi:hypothetical protein